MWQANLLVKSGKVFFSPIDVSVMIIASSRPKKETLMGHIYSLMSQGWHLATSKPL